MDYLYELTLKHRELIEKKLAELCAEDFYIKYGCKNIEDCRSIQNLLTSLFFEQLNNDNSCEQIVEKLYFKEIQDLMAKGNEYKVFINALNDIKYAVKDVIFIIARDNAELYKCVEQSDKSFDCMHMAIYNQWSALQNNNAMLKKVFELIPFGIFIFGENRFSHVNSVGEKLTGYTNAELNSMSIKDLLHPDFYNILTGDINNWKGNSEIKVSRFECKIFNKNGDIVWVDVSVGQVEIKGNSCLLAAVIDISDRKKIDELKKQAYENMKLLKETLEYDKLKTEFFANLSHELRTPLNVILGTLQVMDMFNYKDLNFTDEKMKKYSKIMRQNCYRLLRLVNNLIDLNKLDTGYMNLHMDNYDIVHIVSQIASSVADYIESKGIHFFFEAKTDSKIIACDPDKMERIILNLLSNAIKFTESGGKIMVKLWDEKESLFISVKDTGIGIPKDKQDIVFKRFAQLDKSLSRVNQGSGIGLSLVKSLVELHGGSICLISEAGTGCEFIIELPIKQTVVTEVGIESAQYSSNNKIETINIEFSDIYSQ